MSEIYDRNDIGQNDDAPSVVRRGAEDGLRMGAVLVAMVLMFLLSGSFAPLMFFALVLFALVPFLAYRMMRRDFLRYPRMRFFSAVWMHGICIFFFGSVLMAVAMYVYLQYADPDYMMRSLHAAIELYRRIGTADALEAADSLQKIIDAHLVPSAIDLSVVMIWLVSFSGSMLSMVLSWLVRLLNNRKE